jgi:NADH:ubiquinone oxidoreductase subunit 6 (subunit J)
MLNFTFFFFLLLTLSSALYVLWSKNVLHSAYALLLTFLGMAALYVFAQADVLAVAQIMVYVGGILVLLIFGVMLTHSNATLRQQATNHILTTHQHTFVAGVVAISIYWILTHVIQQTPFSLLERSNFEPITRKTTVQPLGVLLMTDYVLPFEIAGILLMVALIGAAYLSEKK